MSRHPSKLIFLDGLRGLAALYVLAGHARWLLAENYAAGYAAHPEQFGLLAKALVFLSFPLRWGHEAVLFFFVLSGLVIHLRYARRAAELGETKMPFLPYLVRRGRRLYPPLILALVVTFTLDALGARLGLSTASGTTPYPLINHNIGHDHSLGTAARNLLFVMNPVFGSDGPLWSLTYEWYFYLLYPALIFMTGGSVATMTAAVAGLSVFGFLPLWPAPLAWLRDVCQLMIVWWFGALLAECYVGRLRISFRALAFSALVFMVVPFWRPEGSVYDIAVGVGVTGVIAGLFALEERGSSLLPLVKLRSVGAMSYTLYVIHFPILALMSGYLMKTNAGALPLTFRYVGLGMLTCMAAAWLAHWLVERPFTSR